MPGREAMTRELWGKILAISIGKVYPELALDIFKYIQNYAFGGSTWLPKCAAGIGPPCK